MKISYNDEINTAILEPENDKMRITDKGRTFYTTRLETHKDCIDLYEEVYYNKNLAKEVSEEPSDIILTEDQRNQIRDIKNMIDMLQQQLEDILK